MNQKPFLLHPCSKLPRLGSVLGYGFTPWLFSSSFGEKQQQTTPMCGHLHLCGRPCCSSWLLAETWLLG